MKYNNYLVIERKNVEEEFKCFEEKGNVYLKYGGARPIKAKFPIKLSEEMARISGMILDGSLNKDHYSVMFSQKKDPQKIKEFTQICYKNFGIRGKVRRRKDGCFILVYSNKTLAKFFHSCLDIHKSDEPARIPKWIWKSPKKVTTTYLRYAFAMEGSVEDYRKGNEVKFHSCDLSYLKELQELLLIKFGIESKIQKYYIKSYGNKYYLRFSSKKNITKFLKIGFALKKHQKRLKDIVKNFKSKSWEVTLVKILNLKNKIFTAKEVNHLFDYLCKRAVHERLTILIKKRFISRKEEGNKYLYSMTLNGLKKANSIKNDIRITKLRTNPQNNEKIVFNYLKENGISYRNKIARELKINVNTIRDTLKRLLKKGKIRLIKIDRFQRRLYSVI